ncbi:MAG: hypothetical protein ACK5LT_12305, partial [Lachnospirales bacterium]
MSKTNIISVIGKIKVNDPLSQTNLKKYDKIVELVEQHEVNDKESYQVTKDALVDLKKVETAILLPYTTEKKELYE